MSRKPWNPSELRVSSSRRRKEKKGQTFVPDRPFRLQFGGSGKEGPHKREKEGKGEPLETFGQKKQPGVKGNLEKGKTENRLY